MAEKKPVYQARVNVECKGAKCGRLLEWSLGNIVDIEAFKKEATNKLEETMSVPCGYCGYTTQSKVYLRWIKQGMPLFEQRLCACNGCKGIGKVFWLLLTKGEAA